MIRERSITGEEWARALPKARVRRAGTQDRISQAILKHKNTMNTPKANASFEAAQRAAEYCYGKPIGTQGWRDIACAMRDDARKYEDIALELESRVKELGDKCDEWTRLYADQSARLRVVTERLDSPLFDAHAKVAALVAAGDAMLAWMPDGDTFDFERNQWDTAKSGELPPHPDTERLDWLQSQGNRMHGWSVLWALTGPAALELRQQSHQPSEVTIRAAIDAAMTGGAK